MPVRAVLFDAGHTLLEMDYAAVTSALAARGHAVTQEAVTAAERRARIRLDHEQAAQPTRARTGGGRYVRYLLEALGITDTGEQRAVAEWRRAFNLPVGLCHRADAEAVDALQRVRAAGLATGVISNSNGSVRFALEQAGLAAHLDFIIDSTVVGIAKPDPACSIWDCKRPAPLRRRRSTSATRTSSTCSARARSGWARSSSIPASYGARATVTWPTAWARPSASR